MISTGIKSDETLLKTKRFASYGFFSGYTYVFYIFDLYIVI